MNTVTITGNLTADPELGHTPSGVAYAKFSVANNGYVNGESVLNGFFDCVTWRDQAENVANDLSKGDPVVVTGRLAQDRWQAEDGTNRSRVHIEALTVGSSKQFKQRERVPEPTEPPRSNVTAEELPESL